MSSSRKSWPPFVGRGDLVRSGLDLEGADRSLARWYGFEYKSRVLDPEGGICTDPEAMLPERVAEPRSAPEPDATDAHPLFCKRLTILDDDTLQPTAPPPTVIPVAWGNRPKTRPQFYPLMSGQRLEHIVEQVLTTDRVRGKPDVQKVIRNIARGQPLVDVPRQTSRQRAETLQIIVDRSTRLTPIWADQSLIVNQIRRLFPGLALLIWVFEEASGSLRPVALDTPSRPRPDLGPVLALSDLGLLGHSGMESWWRDFARQITFGDGDAHVLLPLRDAAIAYPLIGPWQITPWQAQTTTQAEPQAHLDRLLTLASPAIRLEPGLLRGLRMQVLPDACVTDEIAVWSHPVLASRSVEAASFDPAGKEMYLRRLAVLASADPVAVTMALSVIRNWRHQGKDEIWYEEVLGLPSSIRKDPQFVDPQDIAAADAFFANMHSVSAQGDLSSQHEAWLSRVGHRNRHARDGIWQHPHAAAAMIAVLEQDPQFKPPVLIDIARNTQDWYANVTCDPNGDIWMAPGDVTGQPLGTLTLRGSDVEILDRIDGERVGTAEVPKTGTQVRLGAHAAPFVLQSTRSRMEIAALDRSDIPWARRLTEDAIGPIADLEYGAASLRFRWIPPGQSIIGPDPYEPLEKTSSLREEIVLATGFWLMERPLTNLDMRALDGMEDGQHRSLIAPYLDRDDHRPATDFSPLDFARAIDWLKSDMWQADLRLPTPLEWEYACRAGRYDQTTYNGTPQIDDPMDHTVSDIAWCQPAAAQLDSPDRTLQALGSPQPVCQKRPNAWGLYDMLGNVAEWCITEDDAENMATIKGGSWKHKAKDIRSAFAERLRVTTRKNWIGARLAIGKAEIHSRRQIPRPTAEPASSKFIRRNRPPRVNISYQNPYEPEQHVELPFVVGVLADLSGPQSEPSDKPPVEERNFGLIDANNFDDFLANVAPMVTGWVPRYVPSLPGKLFQGRESVLTLDLQIRKMEDFSPYLIVQNHPELRVQLERMTQLETLHQHFYDAPVMAQPIEQFARDEARVAAVVKAMERYERSAEDPVPFDDRVFQKEIMERLSLPANNAWEAQLVINLAQVLHEAADPGLTTSSDIMSAVGSLVTSFDIYLNGQVNNILRSDTFQQLESTWRGLHHLVFNCETDQQLKIKVLNVSKSELTADFLRPIGEDVRNSALYRLVHAMEYEQFGGEPYGVLIGDYAFGNDHADIETLRHMSEICAESLTPFIASADLALFGITSWSELEVSDAIESRMSGPEYKNWTALRESEGAAYLGLTLPPVLARRPYGQDEQPIDGFRFIEETEESDDMLCWMSAAYPMAVNIARSFKTFGWTSRFRGVESGGAVDNLPIVTSLNAQGNTELRGPVRATLSDRHEGELSKLGFMSLLHRNNTDSAAFIGGQSLFKPRSYADAEKSDEASIRARLPFLFPALRFGQYLKVIARDQIGTSMSRRDLQEKMQTWINKYVALSPETSTEAERARKPLAAADIQIDELDEESGKYQARFFLRPSYQIEGLNTSLRLVAKVPSGD